MAFDPNASQLSEEQIIQQVFDPANRALRTDAFVQIDTIHADLVVDIDAAGGDNIALSNADGSKKVTVTTIGPIEALDVNVAHSVLPDGAATEAKQDAGNLSLDNIDNKVATAANQVVEQTKLDTIHSDLVTIESKQDAGNASLSSIDSKVSTAANQVIEIASLQLIDDIVHAPNASLSKGVPLMGQLDDSATILATEDNVSVARITEQRAIHTNLRDNSGVELGTISNPIQISGSFEKFFTLLAASKWMDLATYDQVIPSFAGGGVTLAYYEDGAFLGEAIINDFNSLSIWNVQLTRYIDDDDGTILQDDDDTSLNLD